MNPSVTFGSTEVKTANGYKRQQGTLEIERRIAGRSTARLSIVADSGTVAPSVFKVGTPITIGGIFTNQPTNDGLHVVSSNAGDTTQAIRITGIDASDAAQTQNISLNGTTPVNSSDTDWKTIYTCELDAVCAGTVTVQEASGDATIITLAPGTLFVSDRLFSGFVENVTRRKVVENSTSADMWYDLDCVDVGQVLGRRLCLQDYSDTSIASILSDLFTDILTAEGFVQSWGSVSQILIGATDIENLNAAYKPVSEILDELAQVAGCAWWVDPYRCLHMADAGDAQPATPFALSESVDARNISLSTSKGEYRNREYYVYDQVWSATKTVGRVGDGKATSFNVSPDIYSIAMDKVTVDSITRVVKVDKDKDILVVTESGGEFGNVEGAAADKLEADADDPTDNRNVTVYYISDADAVVVETKALPTGTPNTVQFTNTNMKALCGVKIDGGDPGAGTQVEIRGTVGLPVTSYVTITGSGTKTAGIKATSDTETYYVKPQISVTNDPTHTDVRWCIIQYTNVAGSTAQYQATSLASGVLTGTFGTVAKSVEQMYVGDFMSAEAVSLYCEAEYQYSVGGTAVRQSANGTPPADGNDVTIEYTPMWKSLYTETDGGHTDWLHDDMATLEATGTGYYDHATIEKEPILATEAAIRAAALGDKYGEPPRQIGFETDTDWFFPGEKLTVNLATNFGEDGSVFVVTDVTMRERADTQTDGYQFAYHVNAVYGEDYSAFDRLEVYRRLQQKMRQWVPVENITT